MRKLTIFRAKSNAAAVARMRVFIEDSEAAEFKINGVGCRKLGVLKNGEERTFEIGEQRARVFVLADRAETDYCGSYAVIPAGFEDVRLSGRSRRESNGAGAFRFDEAEDRELRHARKRRLLRLVALLTAAALLLGAAGYYGLRALLAERQKEFSAEGLSLTLTNRFERVNVPGFTLSFLSKNAAVHALREEFSRSPLVAALSLEEYAALIAQSNDQIRSAPIRDGGLYYYEYEYRDKEQGRDIAYLVAIYKAKDAFWVVNFAADRASYPELREAMLDWARSVRFTE